MGETKINGIRYFQPDNTPDVLYLNVTDFSPRTLEELQEACVKHFGEEIGSDDLLITAEYIHTQCLGYDRYDPGDYSTFLVITKRGK